MDGWGQETKVGFPQGVQVGAAPLLTESACSQSENMPPEGLPLPPSHLFRSCSSDGYGFLIAKERWPIQCFRRLSVCRLPVRLTTNVDA